jgi:hypothetical protein
MTSTLIRAIGCLLLMKPRDQRVMVKLMERGLRQQFARQPKKARRS